MQVREFFRKYVQTTCECYWIDDRRTFYCDACQQAEEAFQVLDDIVEYAKQFDRNDSHSADQLLNVLEKL